MIPDLLPPDDISDNEGDLVVINASPCSEVSNLLQSFESNCAAAISAAPPTVCDLTYVVVFMSSLSYTHLLLVIIIFCSRAQLEHPVTSHRDYSKSIFTGHFGFSDILIPRHHSLDIVLISLCEIETLWDVQIFKINRIELSYLPLRSLDNACGH